MKIGSVLLQRIRQFIISLPEAMKSLHLDAVQGSGVRMGRINIPSILIAFVGAVIVLCVYRLVM
jgi:uncharacterized membrane protein YeaQ/YmgE (transglycosylase-associated protein family)